MVPSVYPTISEKGREAIKQIINKLSKPVWLQLLKDYKQVKFDNDLRNRKPKKIFKANCQYKNLIY